jgi:hypothetical protein
MLVFIDESGTNKGSGHSAFALVYVVVSDYGQFEVAIKTIEKELGIEYFHWAKCAPPVREKFFERLVKLEFTAKVALVRNPSFPDDDLERLLPHMLIEKGIHSITLDGEKPGWYTRKLKKILRDKGITTKKLKSASDESSAGIRVADAVAGLARAYHDGKGGASVRTWYDRLRSKRKISLVFE